MLPVLALSALGSTSYLLHGCRQDWLRQKPQRRFKVHLTDNTDSPFRHLVAAAAATSCVGEAELQPNHGPEDNKQHQEGVGGHQQQQPVEQQQQHPYAAKIQQLLRHPQCPYFWCAWSSTASTDKGQRATLQEQQQLNAAQDAAQKAAATWPSPQAVAGAVPSIVQKQPQQLPPPPPLSETPFVWVDSRKKLQAMLRQLEGVPCIGLDAEHSSQHSYLGVTCLLQISTGAIDYLVDCLAVHDNLHLLRPLLADTSVLKVLHGAANDIMWLQRDALLYLVNVFDTEKAAQVLGREEHSLANLLRVYCAVQQDKVHQTADWRIRPLPTVLKEYARTDVHWLVWLASRMVAEMQQRSPSASRDHSAAGTLLSSALQKSNSLCLRLYHKTPAATAVTNSLAAAMRRCMQQLQLQQHQHPSAGLAARDAAQTDGMHNSGQPSNGSSAEDGPSSASNDTKSASGIVVLDHWQLLAVKNRLQVLVTWRDAAARAADEGLQFILPEAPMLELAQQPPSTAKQLLAVVQHHVKALNTAVQHLLYAPKWGVSSAVKKAAKQLVQQLQAATEGQCRANCSSLYLNASAGGLPAHVAPFAGSNRQAGATGSMAHAVDAANGGSIFAGHAGDINYYAGLLAGQGGISQGDSSECLGMQGPAAAQQLGSGHDLLKGGRRQRKGTDEQFRERMIKKFSAKTQVYDNCRMLSVTGELLCFCDMRKLQWYADRGLAELVQQDPPTIRLKFEHKNADQQVGLDGFYSTSRANRCVVCGQEQHYLRYRVVPACYRRCFPSHLKSHRSHDILLLCFDCHQVAHKAAEVVKRQIAAEYGVPLQPLQALRQQLQQQQHSQQTATACSDPRLHPDQQPSKAEPDGELLSAQGDVGLSDYGDGNDAAAADDNTGDNDSANGGASQRMSSYYGDPAPVSAALLAHQARAAAIALLRFGKTIPEGRRQQLEELVARHAGREDIAYANGHVPCADLEAALVAGLGARHRVKTLQKLKGHLAQYKAAEKAAAAGALRIGSADESVPGSSSAETAGTSESDSSADVRDDSSGAAAAVNIACNNSVRAEGSSSTSAAAAKSASQPSSTDSTDSAAAAAAAAAAGRSLAELGHAWHGQQVVSAALAQGGEEALHQLVRRFRRALVLACRPRFLPTAWNVDAIDSREFGEYSVYAKEEATAAPLTVFAPAPA